MTPLDLIPAVSDLFGKAIDRIWPDKTAQAADRARAELAMAALLQEGELKELATRMSAILAEAQSSDPWTSRARPAFLYVIYIMILLGIPMGILSAFAPDRAAAIAAGLGLWLQAIPDSLWTLFGAGYLGYAGLRSYDKAKGTAT